MSANRILTIGPVALTTTLTTNILNPAAAGSGTGYTPTASYIILRHVWVLNKTALAATFSFWLGATGGNVAGTEVIGSAQSVPPNSYFPWVGNLRIDSTQFLVGGAGTVTALTFLADGEVGLA